MPNLFLKSALRSLIKQRTVTLINLIGLAVGMTASVLIFLWVRNELSYDNYHKDAARIYRFTTHLEVTPGQYWVWENSPARLIDLAQREIPGVDGMATVMTSEWIAPLVDAGRGTLMREKNTAFVDKGWFDMFHYEVSSGTIASFLDDPKGIILTEATAEKYFGHQDPVGEVMKLDSVPCVVRAVVKDFPTNTSFAFPLIRNREFRTLDSNSRKNDAEWGNFNYIAFVKLTPGKGPRDFATSLTKIYKHARNAKADNHTYLTLDPLKGMHFESDLQNSSFRHGDRKIVYIFSVLGILLLGIACINYVNLTTARASLRAKEVGVRKVMGAKRGALFVQFLTESTLVSLTALLLTLLLVRLALPSFNHLTQNHFALSATSLPVWEVLGATLLITILLNSVYPALLLTSFQPTKVLRGSNVLDVKDAALRKSLVVVQFAVTLVLLAATIVIDSQMRYVRLHSPQFEQATVFEFRIPSSTWKTYDYDFDRIAGLGMTVKNELLHQSAIARVSISNDAVIDLANSHSGSVDYDGRAKDFEPSVTQLTTDTSFFSIFHLQMKEGRWLNGYASEDRHHFILNETAINEWHIHTPVIGQRFAIHEDTGQIVGVVKDFHFRSFHDKITPLVVYPARGSEGAFIIRAESGKTAQALEAASRVWKHFFPGEPFDYIFLKDSFETLYQTDLSASVLFLVFSWIAVMISALGLFGLVSFMAAQRTREIGIRKVLGASVRQLVTLLSWDFMVLVGLAVLVGLPLAWWASQKWLEGFAYRINLGWWMFGLAALTSLVIALFTVSIQALRAAKANPVDSLRSE